jgi:hypothetical protein
VCSELITENKDGCACLWMAGCACPWRPLPVCDASPPRDGTRSACAREGAPPPRHTLPWSEMDGNWCFLIRERAATELLLVLMACWPGTPSVLRPSFWLLPELRLHGGTDVLPPI